MLRLLRTVAWWTTLCSVSACGAGGDAPDGTPGGRAVAVRFAGRVGGEPFACGRRHDGVGTTSSTFEGLDLRMYVSRVRLIDEAGDETPVALTQDRRFQTDDVALVDFEDGSAGCQDGNPETNVEVHGTVPEGTYRGIVFELGVPFALNHEDSALAPSPLNLTSMFWGWNGGYKFLRIDARSTGQASGFVVHLGSTGCTGSAPNQVASCAAPNRPEVRLAGFDPAANVIVADVAALLSQSNIDEDVGGPALCMSGANDPDCGPIFTALGLGAEGASAQRFFRVE